MSDRLKRESSGYQSGPVKDTGLLEPERIWLALCALSLLTYLLTSESLQAFGGEVARLAAKL